MLLFYIPSPMLACIMLNHFYSPNRLYIHLLWVFTCDFFFFFLAWNSFPSCGNLITPCHLWRVISTHFSHDWGSQLQFFPKKNISCLCILAAPCLLLGSFVISEELHYGIVPYTVLSFRSESRSLLNLLIQLPVEHPTHDVSSVNVYSKL